MNWFIIPIQKTRCRINCFYKLHKRLMNWFIIPIQKTRCRINCFYKLHKGLYLLLFYFRYLLIFHCLTYWLIDWLIDWRGKSHVFPQSTGGLDHIVHTFWSECSTVKYPVTAFSIIFVVIATLINGPSPFRSGRQSERNVSMREQQSASHLVIFPSAFGPAECKTWGKTSSTPLKQQDRKYHITISKEGVFF